MAPQSDDPDLKHNEHEEVLPEEDPFYHTQQTAATSAPQQEQHDEDEDDEYLEDSTTNYNDDDDDFYDNPMEHKQHKWWQSWRGCWQSKSDTTAVWCTKAAVLTVLLISAATAASLTYAYLNGSERDEFETTFSNYANELASNSQQHAETVVAGLDHFSLQLASLQQETLQDYEIVARRIRSVVGATQLIYSPVVTDPMEWQEYSQQHSLANRIALHQGHLLHNASSSSHVADYSIPNFVYNSSASSDYYLPAWQISPPLDADQVPVMINHDIIMMLPDSETKLHFVNAIQHQRAVMTQILPWKQDNNDTIHVSLLAMPVARNSQTVAMVTAVIPWQVFLQNVLPVDSKPVTVLVETCHSPVNHTYQVTGPNAEYMGSAPSRYETADGIHVPFRVFQHDHESCAHTLHIYPTIALQEEFETDTPLYYTLAVTGVFIFAMAVFFVYDLVATVRQNKTLQAAERTDAIIAQLFPARIREQLFMSAALAAGSDEHSTSHRSKKKKTVGGSSHHSDGASSHFGGEAVESRKSPSVAPSSIAPPRSTTASSTAPSVTNTNGKNMRRRRRRPSLGKERSSESLLEFMKQGREAEVRKQQASKAIAELYPETTIMFADIPGFTAWSSIREPAHVFMLLEAVFQTFDEVANRRRVFKIETVGDCYVAAIGVPDPCSDHAVVMARYARECMKQFHMTLQNLELTLGPDTSDLGLRVGLHSGPVTAGVLRGDRARFQLFGDTMNTTARIQTTGQRDCIHVSEQTAALLKGEGKSKWLIQREDQVQAKGKGYLKTFWLKTKRSRISDAGAGSESQEASEHSESESHISFSDNSSLSEVDLMDSEAMLKSMDDKLAGKSPVKKSFVVQKPKVQGSINERLVMWNAELLAQLLRQIIARRDEGSVSPQEANEARRAASNIGKQGQMVVEETAEIISLPEFSKGSSGRRAADVQLKPEILEQLRDYVSTIASMYRENPFHNFEHASHVTMSVSKLLSRIVAPQITVDLSELERKEQLLHDHTYGITSDPLTQFAVVLSALIHDVDHRGVPNFLLAKEDQVLAEVYQNKSIAEQNSVDLAWSALMSSRFQDLRDCIFSNVGELKRFRQLLVNSVIATDIFDKELGTLRKNRWKKAFEEKEEDDTREDINRKATIVIEHIIQASDVSHTMQHWQVYVKWNSRLFMEMYEAFLAGRSDNDPSANWYNGELGFFDNYIIPLAKKLKQCGVFGVSSDEYLNYAEHNRREWAVKGEEIVASMVTKAHEEYMRKKDLQQTGE